MMNDNQFAEAFKRYMQNYATTKGNQTWQSAATMPFRIQHLEFDLDTTPINLEQYKIPARSMHLESIFDRTSLLEIPGEIKLVMDQFNDSKLVSGFKLVRNNDAFDLDYQISQFAFTWDPQPNLRCKIAIMIDISYRPGSTKVQIFGAVNVNALITAPLFTTDAGDFLWNGQANYGGIGNFITFNNSNFNLPGNTSRKGLFFTNQGPGPCYVTTGITQGIPFTANTFDPTRGCGFMFPPGQSFYYPSKDQITFNQQAADGSTWVGCYGVPPQPCTISIIEVS